MCVRLSPQGIGERRVLRVICEQVWTYYEDYGIGERDEKCEQVWAYYEDYGIGECDELREQAGVLRGLRHW
jgi:hypothetical protein